MIRHEHQPPTALQIQGKLPGAITPKRMRTARDQVGHSARRAEVGESGPEPPPGYCPQRSIRKPLLLA